VKRFRFVSPRARRLGVLAGLLLAILLYIWQVVAAWTAPDDVTLRWFGAGIVAPLPAYTSRAVNFRGMGIAAGATGTLAFDPGGGRGSLQVRDMPVLPAGQVYQLWCVDRWGAVDSPVYFRVFIGDGDVSAVAVNPDRMLDSYIRFYITIEPDGGSTAPTGEVVMRND
jgi:hypothetical protein